LGLLRYFPIVLAIILVGGIIAYSQAALSASQVGQTQVTLRVGYPNSMDESEVTDQYAFQLLAAEGIHVIPTYYDSPPLSYEGLIAGQQDVAYDETEGSLLSAQDTTCVGGYMLSGTYLAVAGDGITTPSQLLGKTAEDFGPGTIERYLDYYWFEQAGLPTNTNGPSPNSVFLKNGGENVETVHDLETGGAQMILVDDFILSDLQDPSINNTAHHGPFHVLFYAPRNYYDTCFAVRDDWLANSENQAVIVKFLAALYQAQRFFISNPDRFVAFAEQQLPETPSSEIQFVSTYYPEHYAYWPYGVYNLQGDQGIYEKFNGTNNFFIIAGVLKSPVANDSVKPYGVFNRYFELKALQSLGPYSYPNESTQDSSFIANLQSWVPSWMTENSTDNLTSSG
jgi:ABC-type nitrate/sulfonate/bicarbonate transport system substrate-binding protein